MCVMQINSVLEDQRVIYQTEDIKAALPAAAELKWAYKIRIRGKIYGDAMIAFSNMIVYQRRGCQMIRGEMVCYSTKNYEHGDKGSGKRQTCKKQGEKENIKDMSKDLAFLFPLSRLLPKSSLT